MDKLLDIAFPEQATPSETAVQLTVLDPDSDWTRFLNGGPHLDQDRIIDEAWRALVTECGAADVLAAEHGIDWTDPSLREQIVLALSDEHERTVDVIALACRQIQRPWERERSFARHTPRCLPQDLVSLHGQDIAPLRSALLTPDLLEEADYTALDALQSMARYNQAVTALGAYQAVVHHIPGHAALDVVTCADLEPAMKADLRLPAGWAMVMHDAVPLHAAVAGDQALSDLLQHGRVAAGTRPAVIGALLRADPGTGLRLDDRLGWLWLTASDGTGHRRRFLQPCAFGTHPAGRVLYSYAAQLTFGRWSPPAEPTTSLADRPSQRAVRRAVHTTEADDGAYQQVHILHLKPPPDQVAGHDGPAAPRTGTPRTHGTFRRAYWGYRVRVGIRDEQGQLVGPVYKTGVEGQTYTYESRFYPRTRIRSDLPLRDTTPVYEHPR